MKLFNTKTQSEDVHEIVIDNYDALQGESLFALAAKKKIEFAKREKEAKKSIIETSIKYSVLCEDTSFFGQIKNKLKSDEEMKIIEIPISTQRPI